jgi:malate dehydrogenase (oxaloacetate-decarboxylating)(NADP+)
MPERSNALYYHRLPTPGKLAIQATKPLANQHDLALAYSPGVALACEEIVRDPVEVATLTARANLVAVVTNGSAVLGLGNIGPLAAKPVMEGKAVLFKKFAGVDVFDIELNADTPQQIIETVAALEPTFGGINLEDIKAPECFEVEQALRERLNIPVFHDDQHGTAICVAAAITNGLRLLDKKISDIRLVTAGAGAAALACLDLLVELGLPKENIIVTDIAGVVYTGRQEEMDPYKARYAQDTQDRTLAEALVGADVFLGLSAGKILKPEMLATMVEAPLIFALANPEPEIRPELAREVRPKAIIATGRSDYPNQVNNVLCFPFIFRGALDVGATTINRAMKIACVQAIADLATGETHGIGSAAEAREMLSVAYGSQDLHFGPEFIIPKPFDPRLITTIPPLVAQAAMASGVATRPIEDLETYRHGLERYVFRSGNLLRGVCNIIREQPKRLIYSVGEDERVLRTVQILLEEQCVQPPLLIGRREVIEDNLNSLKLSVRPDKDFILIDPSEYRHMPELAEEYHNIMGRKGVAPALADVSVRTKAVVLAAMLLRRGDADAMIAGPMGLFQENVKHLRDIIGLKPNVTQPAAMQMLILEQGTYFIVDTSVNYDPDAQQLAEITLLAADAVHSLGITPKVALMSHSNFGTSQRPSAQKMRKVLDLIHARAPKLEIEGEMQPDAALLENVRERLFPASRLQDSANLLVMPNLDAASITYNAVKVLGNGVSVGPMLLGMAKSAHILSRTVTTRGVVNLSMLAAL